MVADAADGVCGIGSLTHGDCPHSQPPLAAEDRLTPTCKRSEALSVHCTLATSVPRSLTLSEPHARASAIFLNEFDASGF